MKFFSLEDSKKLAEMGCESESGFVWADVYPNSKHKRPPNFGWEILSPENCDYWSGHYENYPAFIAYDFLGDSEQARRNCEILWGKMTWHTVEGMTEDGCERITNHGLVWENRRKEMLSSPDHIEFVKGFLK